MPLGTEVGLGTDDIVLDGDPDPPPQFSAHVYCGQTAEWMNMALGMEVGLGPGHIVLDWNLAPLPKKGGGRVPHFSAHFYCSQTAGCVKMPLGMEVGLSRGDFVLDVYPAPRPHQNGAEPAIFGPSLLRPNGCMDQDATMYFGFGLRDIVLASLP